MMRILVAYYSRTGHTRRVAAAIASACGAEIEAIRDSRPRTGLLGWWRSGKEAWQGRPADILPIDKDPGEYDLVVIGTPVWAGRMSSPVRAYLTGQQARLKRVALFCTEGGSGGEKVLRQMAALCGHEPLATLVVTERELGSGAVDGKLAGFTRALMPIDNGGRPDRVSPDTAAD